MDFRVLPCDELSADEVPPLCELLAEEDDSEDGVGFGGGGKVVANRRNSWVRSVLVLMVLVWKREWFGRKKN